MSNERSREANNTWATCPQCEQSSHWIDTGDFWQCPMCNKRTKKLTGAEAIMRYEAMQDNLKAIEQCRTFSMQNAASQKSTRRLQQDTDQKLYLLRMITGEEL